MPELPEVETLVRQLQKSLSGAVLSKIIIHRADMVKSSLEKIKELESQKVAKFIRRGKFLGIKFESLNILWFHLGMTGRLYLQEKEASTEPHLHVVLEWKSLNKKLLFQDVRRFGRVFMTDGSPESFPEGLRKMGPEPLEVSAEDFLKLFKRRSGSVKSLLLNQRIIAGIGNIYADESLFRAGIDPRKKAGTINAEKIKRLYASIRETLQAAIQQGGSTIRDYISLEGQSGGFQKFHRVYGKQGKPCSVCGEKIRKVVLAGRSSFFCSQCQ